jgi:hypothetical protein
MSGVVRRPFWTIQFVRALTLAALVAALTFLTNQAVQSRENRAASQQGYFDGPSGRTKCNSHSDVLGDFDVTHLTIAAALPAALDDGDCYRIVRPIEHFIAAVFPKQVEFHNSHSKQHKTNLEAVPLDWQRNCPTWQDAPSAGTEQFNQCLKVRVFAAVAPDAPERLAETLVNWNNARDAL